MDAIHHYSESNNRRALSESITLLRMPQYTPPSGDTRSERLVLVAVKSAFNNVEDRHSVQGWNMILRGPAQG